MCLPNISVFPVFMFAFIFHRRSFSPCWPLAFLIFSPPLWISMFFSLQNSSPLFSITRSSSFSVIYVSVNIKNDAEKDTTLLLFFLSKSPGGHVISFQIKPWVAFGLPYLLIELFYIGMSVARTDGRSLARSVYGHSDYQIDYYISLAMGLKRRACSSAINLRDINSTSTSTLFALFRWLNLFFYYLFIYLFTFFFLITFIWLQHF